jgi:hypothetical protein
MKIGRVISYTGGSQPGVCDSSFVVIVLKIALLEIKISDLELLTLRSIWSYIPTPYCSAAGGMRRRSEANLQRDTGGWA